MNAPETRSLAQTYLADTHEPLNLSSELADFNPYEQDRALREAVLREGAAWADDGLRQFGAQVGSAAHLELGVLANRHPPELDTHDRFGRRADEVEFHPSYHALMAAARESEVWLKPEYEKSVDASIADAVKASCSAYPFFERTTVRTSMGEDIELIDGGYCANNPTLYAIADAVQALKRDRKDIRLVSVGVGIYPDPKPGLLMWLAKKYLVSVQLLQKTLEINTQSMDQLRQILFHDVPTIRISDSYVTPEMATDLLEHDLKKLGVLFQRGRESFASREKQLREYLT